MGRGTERASYTTFDPPRTAPTLTTMTKRLAESAPECAPSPQKPKNGVIIGGPRLSEVYLNSQAMNRRSDALHDALVAGDIPPPCVDYFDISADSCYAHLSFGKSDAIAFYRYLLLKWLTFNALMSPENAVIAVHVILNNAHVRTVGNDTLGVVAILDVDASAGGVDSSGSDQLDKILVDIASEIKETSTGEGFWDWQEPEDDEGDLEPNNDEAAELEAFDEKVAAALKDSPLLY